MHNLLVKYGPYLISLLPMVWSYITTTLSLAIGQADKDNNGQLSDEELEDLAVYLIQNSRTSWVHNLPEGFVRRIIQKLCARRSRHLGGLVKVVKASEVLDIKTVDVSDNKGGIP